MDRRAAPAPLHRLAVLFLQDQVHVRGWLEVLMAAFQAELRELRLRGSDVDEYPLNAPVQTFVVQPPRDSSSASEGAKRGAILMSVLCCHSRRMSMPHSP